MEERTLIQSENTFANPKFKRLLIIIAILLVVITVLSLLCFYVFEPSLWDKAWAIYKQHHRGGWHGKWDSPEYEAKYNALRNTSNTVWYLGFVGLGLAGLLLLSLITILIPYLIGRVQQITVTDKRVYGVAAFKRRVDLPLDSISAISTSLLKGLSVASSSGRIIFIGIKNRDDIHKVISDLLIERQTKPIAVVQEANLEALSDVTAQLKQMKELLDSGILTQEEFDAKKKQLLGL